MVSLKVTNLEELITEYCMQPLLQTTVVKISHRRREKKEIAGRSREETRVAKIGGACEVLLNFSVYCLSLPGEKRLDEVLCISLFRQSD